MIIICFFVVENFTSKVYMNVIIIASYFRLSADIEVKKYKIKKSFVSIKGLKARR